MKRLFLVDDDDDDRDFFRSVFDSLRDQVQCETASSALLAWERLTTTPYRPDIIFLDLNMPIMNGKELLKLLKSHADFSPIPVIILSTSSNEKTIHEALELGAAEFITKPNKLSILEQQLGAVLNNHAYFQNPL